MSGIGVRISQDRQRVVIESDGQDTEVTVAALRSVLATVDETSAYPDLDRFQAEVKTWAYANFGSPDDGRTIRLEKLYESLMAAKIYKENAPTGSGYEVRLESQTIEEIMALVRDVTAAPPDAPSWRPLVGAFEEMGELGHAHLKGAQGIRHTPEEIADKKLDAVGDVLVYLADYCNREDISMGECITRAWDEVRERDWREQTGMTMSNSVGSGPGSSDG